MNRGPTHTSSERAAALPGDGATFVYAALAVILAARLAVSFWPAMWLWGLNTQRFVIPPVAILAWVLMALPFVGPLGAWIARQLDRLGDGLHRSRATRVVAAGTFAAAVYLIDDRTFFTGDALIRRAASNSPEFLSRFGQAMPLELLLFERLPLAFQGVLRDGTVSRLIGLVAAVGLAIASIGLARELGARGARLVAAASLVRWGGWLAAFTGLGKPSAVLCTFTVLAAWQGIRAARTGRGIAGLGLVVFAGVVLHRAGTLLLPAWLAALVFAARRRGAEPRPHSGTEWAFALLPIGALGVLAGRILHVATAIDLPAHLESRGASPWRALDLANLTLLLAPAALPVLLGAWLEARSGRAPESDEPHRSRVREAIVLLALAVPWWIVVALAAPVQGLFRDLDVFAPGGVALGALGAWALAGLSAGGRRAPNLDAAVTLACVVPALQLLLCFHDPAGGLARVGAYLAEPPRRSDTERETTWDFVALQSFGRNDWPLAARASEEAARLAPSTRILMMLGISRTYLGDYPGAEQAYRRVIERSPGELVAWAGLAGIATRLGERALADSATAMVRRYPETSAKARELRALIRQYPEFGGRRH